MEYIVVAFDESTRKFMHRYVNSNSKIQAMLDFEEKYEDCTVINVIGNYEH